MFFTNLKTTAKRIATRVSTKVHRIRRKERVNPELVRKVTQLQESLDLVRKQCEEAARVRAENEKAAQEAEAKLAAEIEAAEIEAARIRAENEQIAKEAENNWALAVALAAEEEAARVKAEKAQAAQEARLAAEIKADLEQVELQIANEHRAQQVLREEIARALQEKKEIDNLLQLAEEREECYRTSLRKDADVYELYTHYIAEAEHDMAMANQAIECLKSEIHDIKTRKAATAWLDTYTDKRDSVCRPDTPSSMDCDCDCECN
ncbi:hypothetical protein EV183_000336 [Coemansia sp. RSA 2336]|nr:hypothetical protein EV183_000336 [Coemansia sp. RSA 2336]